MSIADKPGPRPVTRVMQDPPFLDAYDPMYPDDDGNPMAESTQQFDWIVTIKEGLEALYRDDPDVFVAGDLLWYYTEGKSKDSVAPDVMIVFGRPKGHRHSYKQWLEFGVAPQVVFEVHSPSNTAPEMARKHRFYEARGVEEYYYYKPEVGELRGWIRDGEALRPIPAMDGWRSPRLNVSFESPPVEDGLIITGPDGRAFVSAATAILQRNAEAERADDAERRLEFERRVTQAANRRADAERGRADAERERAERLAARLRELGIEPD